MRWFIPVLLLGLSPAWAQTTDPATPPVFDQDPNGIALDDAPFKQTIAIACDFKTECVEDEPCTETEFKPTIEGIAGGLSAQELVVQSQMVTDAETVELLGVKSGAGYSLSGGSFSDRHLLTIAEGGATRYTVHYADGPFVISYLGTCN